jgi:hypothetical protein
MLTKAICSSGGFEQELEDLHVTSRLLQIVAPSVQPMTAQQETMACRQLAERRLDTTRER